MAWGIKGYTQLTLDSQNKRHNDESKIYKFVTVLVSTLN